MKHLTRIVCLGLARWHVALGLLVTLAFSAPALAADYVFPGALPSNCTASSGTYTCTGSVTLGYQDTVVVNDPRPATINVVGGNLTVPEQASINAGGTATNLTINVSGVFSTTGTQSTVNANITAASITGSREGAKA